MAEAELTLRYRELPVKLAYWALAGTVPLLALFTLICAVNAVFVDSEVFANLSFFIFGLFSTLGGVILGLILSSDSTVFLTRDGVSLPFVLSPGFGFRSQHRWADLRSVNIQPWGKHGILQLSFKDGRKTRLKLDLLPEKDIERLIVCMDVWAGGGDNFPCLLEARVKLKESSGDLQIAGYTEIWEEELTRRFGPTNFVPLEPGDKVLDFTVERQLAFGGLSAIYQVRNEKHERYVLKEAVVPADADESMRQTAEKMLNREAQILSSLSHPNIARVFDNFLDSGRHYILMELVKGEDLRRLVKEHGAQPESDVAAWAVQLLDILSYLHGQQPPVVHRDLSPDNLILGENGQLCVIDFGAANHFVGAATGTLIGKQAYIAPEQLRGKAEPGSDIYAFGCTLYFLLTASDPEPLSVAHVCEANSAVSKNMDGIIAACTAQEAEARPSVSELKELLRACLRSRLNV